MKLTYTRGAPKTAQQIKNLEQLLILWELTPPEAVVVSLDWWKWEGNEYPCGAVACLGGHARESGFFPGLASESRDWFGAAELFSPRLVSEVFGTDWEVAHRRILKALETKEQT
jgi:hypothetical protein